MKIGIIQLGFSLLLSACCPFQADGDIQGSPSVRYFDGRGERVPFGPTGIVVDSLTNLARPGVPVVWEVNGAFDGTFPDPDQVGFLQILSASEFGFTEEDLRTNRVVVNYTLNTIPYSDTIVYVSRKDEQRCVTTLRIDPVREVNGPLVDRFENASDFPGVLVFFRDTL